ncbi:hypothetical protein HUW83_06530 [Fusobacterium animalis]|uniref:hypothetical protein n=1 Tax=Fusobacterium animalis TaxID=76859 RepID=UPI0030CE8997
MEKNIDALTKEILKDYISGNSLKKIRNRYGDFGIDYINKYRKQNISESLIDLLSSENNEELKKEIYKSYISGMSKKEIKNKYGDFGILIISKILEKLPIPKI